MGVRIGVDWEAKSAEGVHGTNHVLRRSRGLPGVVGVVGPTVTTPPSTSLPNLDLTCPLTYSRGNSLARRVFESLPDITFIAHFPTVISSLQPWQLLRP